MSDVLIYADTVRSPELRHEVPMTIVDPFLYVERDGVRHIVVSSMEIPLLAELGGYELHPLEEFGLDELRRSGLPSSEIFDELVVRAVRELGVEDATVPATFPVLVADRLRAAGVELTPARAAFDRRRRVKAKAELEGIRRAQTAAEAGMSAARDLLRRARPNGAGLEVDGEPLTSERVKSAIRSAFLEHGASCDAFIVSHGPQSAIGHHLGEGQIRAGEPILIDIWPHDDLSTCSADMTRTFVVGDVPAEVRDWHRLSKQALDRALGDIRPGVTARSVFDAACDVFEGEGYPTQRTKPDGETLTDGFFHSLGHGVGLEVHEEPLLGIAGADELVAGDVLAIEPGLYRRGLGGCRLEDLVLVTDTGAEKLTSFPYELEP
ncbi:MAG TPA: Xaa-Pro peptidase family protein [Gaiellaceae bacterium]